jgi:hypothetical protein
MLGLCKCCLGYSSLEEKKFGSKEGKDGKLDSPEIFDLKARLVSSDPVIVVDEPTKQNSSFAEDDSGACCQDEVSKSMSREISGENITISSSLLEESEMIDRVQLTVSSVNTVLEDLQETEDENDYEEEKSGREITPLLPQIKVEERIYMMKDKNPVDGVIPHPRTTFRVIRANRQQHLGLKVDVVDTNGSSSSVSSSNNNALFASNVIRTTQSRHSAGLPVSNGVILSGSKSATSSRHNSGDSSTKLASVLKNRHCVSVTSTKDGVVPTVIPPVTAPVVTVSTVSRDRERSPCVSFGTDVVYVESVLPERRPRSRSDASSRFRSSSVVDWHKSKIAWLRERREQRRKEGSEKSLVTKKDSKEEDNDATEEREKVTSEAAESKPVAEPTETAEVSVVAELDPDVDLPPTPRARARSEKFFRPNKKEVLGEVSKKTPFDWPLGRLGKLRQKYSKKDESGSTTPPKSNYTVRSMSVAALTKHEAARYSSRLKRNNSEKQKDQKKHRVAFDKSYSSTSNGGPGSWLTKLFFDKSGKQTKKRRRHPTDPDSREFRFFLPSGVPFFFF